MLEMKVDSQEITQLIDKLVTSAFTRESIESVISEIEKMPTLKAAHVAVSIYSGLPDNPTQSYFANRLMTRFNHSVKS